MSARVATWLGLLRFSHTVFALPFALLSAWVAAGGMPPVRTLLLVLVCAVAARTAAMAFNRLVDREIDARNPRTRDRELPRGAVTPRSVGVLVAASSAVFVAGAFLLNPLSGRLSFPVLAVLLGYSTTKRFTWLSHAVLGLALALAPLGAWLAVRGDLEGDLRPPLLLAAGVLAWVAGFDLIYSCQDAEFDAHSGLASFPARFGARAALLAARALHAAAVLSWALFGRAAGLGSAWWIAFLVASLLLLWEHRLVHPDDLSRVDLAFFTLNGWAGIGLFAGGALDLALR